MIKTSTHKISNGRDGLRVNKAMRLYNFLTEYQRCAQVYLDYLWVHPISWRDAKCKVHVLNLATKQYDVPQFFSNQISDKIELTTDLSARALKCCQTQVCGIVKAALEKPRKRLGTYHDLKKRGESTVKIRKAIRNQKIVKPSLTNMRAELNSICADLTEANGKFNAFLRLHSLGKAYGSINIPIQYHRHSLTLARKGIQKNHF
jgi:hypothetical protein